jgi:heat shock protein HtpX
MKDSFFLFSENSGPGLMIERKAVVKNYFKTIFLLTLLTVAGSFSGYALDGRSGMMVAFCLTCLVNFSIYRLGDRIVLAIHRAQLLTEGEAPEVFDIVEMLSVKAGVPMPRIYMLPSASANAFVTGRDSKHASIAVTHGLVGLLNEEELSGVLGHEVSHIRNRDILPASVAATLAVALSMIASLFRWSFFWGGERDERDCDNPLPLLLFAAVMPFVAILIRLTISRAREYDADKRGARLCEDPLYLASALKKIDAFSSRFPLRNAAPATAHLFIANSLPAKGWLSFFRTHPSMEDRIARLENIGGF